MSVTLTLTT